VGVVLGLVVVLWLVATIVSGIGGSAALPPRASPAARPESAAPAPPPPLPQAPVAVPPLVGSPVPPPAVQCQWQDIENQFKDLHQTSMQEAQVIDALRGTWVQMTGEVSDVGSTLGVTYVGMKCNPRTLTSDTHVNMSMGQSDALVRLARGQRITVVAQFETHGLLGHYYRNGRLVP
jgi:hypothetical protein